MRLGIYADLVFSADADGGIHANRAFVKFVAGLPPRVDELVFFGRLIDSSEPFLYPLPQERVRFVGLPHYDSARDLLGVAAVLPRSVAALRRELPNIDVLWLFGPHPVSLAFARAARRAKVPVMLGVRQDFPAYVKARAMWAFPGALALEWTWRRLARRAPVVVVGDALALTYRRAAAVLSTGFSLIGEEELVRLEDAQSRDWSGPLRLLTVGRLSPEKNPLLLPEIVARLDARWQLHVVGEGPLHDAVADRAAELGVSNRLHLQGYVPNGPALWREYRSAHAFLHVSWTEGIPQVLFEAQASGLPIVATDVGGVRAAMDDTAVLVAPGDAGAAARAVGRLADEADERLRLVSRGLDHVREQTQEAQLDEIARFLDQQFG